MDPSDQFLLKIGREVMILLVNYWISTIAKIPSTEQDGGINVMSMGRNGSNLAWMTTTTTTITM